MGYTTPDTKCNLLQKPVPKRRLCSLLTHHLTVIGFTISSWNEPRGPVHVSRRSAPMVPFTKPLSGGDEASSGASVSRTCRDLAAEYRCQVATSASSAAPGGWRRRANVGGLVPGKGFCLAVPVPLVPKLCLGTAVRETPFRGTSTDQSLKLLTVAVCWESCPPRGRQDRKRPWASGSVYERP